jgi:hypothetical protein
MAVILKRELKLESEINTPGLETSMLMKDSLGLLNHHHSLPIGLTPELSVTRLAVLAECPLKFYLKNICKIDLEKNHFQKSADVDEEEEIFYSSKDRGTKMHLTISKFLKQEITSASVDEEMESTLQWIENLIQPYQKFSVNS